VKPLDLSKQPPRSPRAALDGLTMLPRTIDKMRALLPGGNIGSYRIAGLSKRMLDAIGLEEEALQAVVASALSDDEVATWLREHADVSKYEEWNEYLLNRSIDDIAPERLAKFQADYPVSKELTSRKLVDLLEADDAEMFGRTKRPG
jgi:hypothetical protein